MKENEGKLQIKGTWKDNEMKMKGNEYKMKGRWMHMKGTWSVAEAPETNKQLLDHRSISEPV